MQPVDVSKPSREKDSVSSSRRMWLAKVLALLFCAPVAGLAASLVAVVSMGILRLVAGIPAPVELFGDRVLKSLDVFTFVRLLITFAPNSKTAPLGLALLGMIALGTLLGILYAILVRPAIPVTGYRPGRRDWFVAAIFAAAMTLLGVVLFWGELGQNLFGLPLQWAALLSGLGLGIDFALYAFTLCLVYRALLPKELLSNVPAVVQQRRQLFANVGVTALSIGAGAGAFGLVRGYLVRYASYDGMTPPIHAGNVTPPITPNNEHYVVTQNTLDPTPNIDLWRLEITGLVKEPGTYTYAEMEKLPSISRAVTLECIANGIGGHLISTAIWQGVRLQTLLDLHGGVKPGASYVAFYSVDGYTVSLPLQELLAVDPIFAWRMNGEVLPQRHGYPLRALIPGRYGEENPKWLTRIEVTDHFVSGLYADQGWYNGPLHTITRIDRPRGQITFGQTIEVGGIAFAGNRGIKKVEINVDGGANWQAATLQPPLSLDSWVLWTWNWRPASPGTHTLTARSTDGTGETQTAFQQITVPNGAMGYHTVVVRVV